MPPLDCTHVVSDVVAPCGDGYRVAWCINPHMRVGATRLEVARAQHQALRAALVAAGARLLALPFVARAYDSVFVKDPAVLVRRCDGTLGALVGRPRHAERRAEVAARRAQLASLGFAVTRCPVPLEGGDVVRAGERTLLGHGFRSSPEAAAHLAAFTCREVVAVELRDPALYHLDTAVASLDGGELLVAEGALDRGDALRLARLAEARRLAWVPRDEAMRFATNLVQVGRHVLLARGAERTADRLARWGYEPILLELDQFLAAGGSAACLTAPIHPMPAAIAAVA